MVIEPSTKYLHFSRVHSIEWHCRDQAFGFGLDGFGRILRYRYLVSPLTKGTSVRIGLLFIGREWFTTRRRRIIFGFAIIVGMLLISRQMFIMVRGITGFVVCRRKGIVTIINSFDFLAVVSIGFVDAMDRILDQDAGFGLFIL
ncbi:hypothetical protein H261_21998 [Paramagnetospirillum caucaseum]|uniref:Uncharacterized protein n=1 Tax=Paramagnetospirillum caucaseum TaxID=1244869 RepID=M3A4F6_9PROT|nr:hypothetical protein H261_21998 [Paramagnetospirillum caucaseum]